MITPFARRIGPPEHGLGLWVLRLEFGVDPRVEVVGSRARQGIVSKAARDGEQKSQENGHVKFGNSHDDLTYSV